MRRQLSRLEGRRLAGATVKVLAASVVMAAVAAAVEHVLTDIAPGSGVLLQAGRVGLAIGTGMTVLVSTARILRITEFNDALALLRERVRLLLAR